MPYLLFFKKQLNLKLSSAANCKWRFKGYLSIFKDKSVISSIPTYFENKESPIICYKYNKSIRSTFF